MPEDGAGLGFRDSVPVEIEKIVQVENSYNRGGKESCLRERTR